MSFMSDGTQLVDFDFVETGFVLFFLAQNEYEIEFLVTFTT